MKKLLGTIIHKLTIIEPGQLIYILSIIVITIALTILYGKIKEDEKKLGIWKMLCFMPVTISILHFMFNGLGSMWQIMLVSYFSMYLPSLIPMMWPLFTKNKRFFVVSAVVINFAVITMSVSNMLSLSPLDNLGNKSYAESFKASIDAMEENYVLEEWKEVDFDAIEAKLLPMVEQADENGDEIQFLEAMVRMSYEIHDGHVCVVFPDDETKRAVDERLFGNDYGLSMIGLDSGEVVAVLVDAEVVGIKEGTQIVKWNGVTVEEALADVECISTLNSYPVAANEEAVKPLFLAGKGEATVEVTYLDESGKECTVELASKGSYYDRFMKSWKLYFGEPDAEQGNYATKMLNEDTGYFVIMGADYDSNDEQAYLMGEHENSKKMFEVKLKELKDQGATKLIIDLRNNYGGTDQVVMPLVSYFAMEDQYGIGLGYNKDGKYKVNANHNIEANGNYHQMQVVVLVNGQCMDAGDGLAYHLSKLPNVTIMGITEPNGSNQESGGMCLLPGGAVLSYPVGLVLDENKEPLVDTRADRVGRNPLDVKIPFDNDAAIKMFSGEGDYELEYAVEYLKSVE
ncbi:MAG: hypothetical protein IKJ73_08765 [Lachnospiraceae bacterium]|nr:hypothetical protein [Lachnospiraceae bacterium]